MADAYTTTSSLDIEQTAYDRLVRYALRPRLHFRNVVDVRPTRQSMPGSAVVFTLVDDLSIASTALNESTDVDAVALADSQVTVTLNEYGNVAITTAKLRGTSFVEVDPIVADVLAFNAAVSLDELALIPLRGGDNVRYATGGATTPTARNTVEPDDTLEAANVRRALADLKGANVEDFGGLYAAFIHPDVSYDLRSETGAAAWRDPHTYSQPAEIWTGEVGAFEGFRFMEMSRAPKFADAGSSTTLTDVYATIFLGRQALAEAFSTSDGNGRNPRVVPGPVVDHLRRFVPMGWYWLGGFARFREAAIRRVESSSSIGSN